MPIGQSNVDSKEVNFYGNKTAKLRFRLLFMENFDKCVSARDRLSVSFRFRSHMVCLCVCEGVNPCVYCVCTRNFITIMLLSWSLNWNMVFGKLSCDKIRNKGSNLQAIQRQIVTKIWNMVSVAEAHSDLALSDTERKRDSHSFAPSDHAFTHCHRCRGRRYHHQRNQLYAQLTYTSSTLTVGLLSHLSCILHHLHFNWNRIIEWVDF